MPTTEAFIAALKNQGLSVKDMRGLLPVHESRSFSKRNSDALKGLVCHHAAMSGGELTHLERIARYHVGPNNHVSPGKGCPGILYTMSVLADGTVTINHDVDVATWSQGYKQRAGDENKEFLAVLFLGNFDSPSNQTGEEPTFPQLDAWMRIIWACFDMWGWHEGQIYGHFDFGKPACPGSTLERMIRAIRTHAVVEHDYDFSKPAGRQQALLDAGYDITVDGIWGPNSKTALAQFQAESKLTVDGLWGPRTEAALLSKLNS